MADDRRSEGASGSTPAEAGPTRCPGCGQVVGEDASACPFCDRPLLFDVVAVGSVGAEQAIRAARELESLGMGREQLLREGLDQTPGAILSAVTRREAVRCRARLEDQGVSTRLVRVPAASSRRPRGRVVLGTERGRGGLGWLWLFGALAALAALAALIRLASVGGPEPDLQPRRSKVLLRAREAVVTIEREEPSATGPSRIDGFTIDGGLLVTAASLAAEEGDRLRVDGATGATTTTVDEWLGVAVAELVGPADHSLELGDATGTVAGQTVLLPGAGYGQAIVRDPATPLFGLALIELDAAPVATIQGGPVLDDAGRVIGVLLGAAHGPGRGALVLPVNYLGMGAEALLAVHRDALETDSWSRWLASAGLPTRLRPQDLIAELGRPCLLEAICHHRGRVTVLVGRLSPDRPASGRLSFQLEGRGPRPRTRQVPVPGWKPMPLEHAGRVVPPEMRWLERRGHHLYYYTAEVSMRFTGKWGGPVGGELVLNGARAGADRVKVTAAVSRSRRSLESQRSLGQRPRPTRTPVIW